MEINRKSRILSFYGYTSFPKRLMPNRKNVYFFQIEPPDVLRYNYTNL